MFDYLFRRETSFLILSLDFQQHRMSALIHLREKLMNRKHNIIVFNALRTLFTVLSYLAMPRLFGSIFVHFQ